MRTTARTTSGPVKGTSVETADGTVAAFLGVPFAAPPVGDLRWRAPQPPAPWHEPLDATRFGPSAPQPSGGPLDGLVPGMGVAEIDEDCLTLNVWTPGVDADSRPVLVWIHGGGFTIGGSALETYDGSLLAAREDVVVVSCNYRVGALGFMVIDHPDTQGNCGILDQVAALTWVRDNITAFGGDPGRVAVFGESAGAGSILSLLSTTRSEGLFRAAIVQSGATDLVLTREKALAVTDAFATAAGVGARDIDALRALPVEEVIAAQASASQAVFATVGMMAFHPTVDGEVMAHDWLGAAKAGLSRNVALVIGTTHDEMLLFASYDPAAASLDDGGLQARFARMHPDPAALVDAYRAVEPDAAAPAVWGASTTDTAMWLPALRVAEAHAAHQPDTWMYRFDWPAADPALGACHGIDIPFPFDTIDRAGWDEFVARPAEAHALARAEQAAWAAVARTGAPATDALPTWPRFDAMRRATMILDAAPHVEDDPRGPVREAWSSASTLPS
jgi:para-nitrobenzyl esterase